LFMAPSSTSSPPSSLLCPHRQLKRSTYRPPMHAEKGTLYFRNLLTELITVVLPIRACLDNIGAGCIAQNYVNNSRTKHIDVKYHMLGSRLDRQEDLRAVLHREQQEPYGHPHQGAGSTRTSWTISSSPWWTSTPLRCSRASVLRRNQRSRKSKPAWRM
jgi:hypothetical protein